MSQSVTKSSTDGRSRQPARREFFLGVDKPSMPLSEESSEYLDAHPDERQVKLDTDRSFVSYPVGRLTGPLSHGAITHAEDNLASLSEKERLKNHLYCVIVFVLRRHPKFSYFQACASFPHTPSHSTLLVRRAIMT